MPDFAKLGFRRDDVVLLAYPAAVVALLALAAPGLPAELRRDEMAAHAAVALGYLGVIRVLARAGAGAAVVAAGRAVATAVAFALVLWPGAGRLASPGGGAGSSGTAATMVGTAAIVGAFAGVLALLLARRENAVDRARLAVTIALAAACGVRLVAPGDLVPSWVATVASAMVASTWRAAGPARLGVAGAGVGLVAAALLTGGDSLAGGLAGMAIGGGGAAASATFQREVEE